LLLASHRRLDRASAALADAPHSDLKRTPRVRAFCDFVGAEIARLRPFLTGNANEGPPSAEE
jgi:hypothetical protein